MGYVIAPKSSFSGDYGDTYGFYQGKCYMVEGEYFPICTNDVSDESVKIYTSTKRAKRAGESLCDKCGYVIDYEIYQLTENGILVGIHKDSNSTTKTNKTVGCNCCAGDTPLYYEDNENCAFIDNTGDMLVTIKDKSMRFKVKCCPNCGREF